MIHNFILPVLLCLTMATSTHAAPLTKQQAKKLTSTLRQALKDTLTDEDSAKFRNEYLSMSEIDGSTEIALCGEVNSKNQFGGYAGFQQYIVTTSDGVIRNTPAVPTATQYLWPIWCSRPIK